MWCGQCFGWWCDSGVKGVDMCRCSADNAITSTLAASPLCRVAAGYVRKHGFDAVRVLRVLKNTGKVRCSKMGSTDGRLEGARREGRGQGRAEGGKGRRKGQGGHGGQAGQAGQGRAEGGKGRRKGQRGDGRGKGARRWQPASVPLSKE